MPISSDVFLIYTIMCSRHEAMEFIQKSYLYCERRVFSVKESKGQPKTGALKQAIEK